ncbi:hypothetical protein JCM10049v2_007506 [Rhodotorula toruloides]
MGALLSLLRELLRPAPPPARIPAKAKPVTNAPRPAWLPFELYRPIIAYAAERREDGLAPQLARFCLVSRAFRAEAQLLLDQIFTLALELEPVQGIYLYRSHTTLREETKYFTLSPRYRRITFSVTPELCGVPVVFCAGPAYEYWWEMGRWSTFLHPRHVLNFGTLSQPRLNNLIALHWTGPAWAHHILQDLPVNWARNKTRPADAVGRRMPGYTGRSLNNVQSLTLLARPHEGLGDNLAPFAPLHNLHLDFFYRPDPPTMDFLECLDSLKNLTITLRYGATALNTLSTTTYPSIPHPSKRRAAHNIVRRLMALVATLLRRLQDLDLNTNRPPRRRKPSSLPLTQHARLPPTLPLELVKEILEVLYDAGGHAGTLAACCAASRAFANVAKPILWRTVVVECQNAVNPYMEDYESQAHLPWFSAESWDLAERTRRQLRLLADNVELGAFVRHFTMADPNGVDRVNTALLWPHDIALLQDALLRFQAVETVRIGAIFSRDGYDLRLPARNPHLHTLRLPTLPIGSGFTDCFPKLRHLYIDDCICPQDLRPTAPPVTTLTIRQGIYDIDGILGSFDRTLTRLELDCVTYGSSTAEFLSSFALRMCSELTHITVVLRGGDDLHQRVENEEMERKRFYSPCLAPSIRDIADLPVILRFLSHLPRCQQVTLALKLPQLADPRLREKHNALWADVLREMRADGSWDELLPVTVRDPNTSPAPLPLIDSPPSRPPTLPLELVEGILEILYDEGGNADALAACCAASRAFARLARPIVWRTIVAECRNVLEPYQSEYKHEAASTSYSSACWDLEERTRRQLRTLAADPEVCALVRTFVVTPPNGVERTYPAMMWPTDFALVHSALVRLPAVETVVTCNIRDPNHYTLDLPASNPRLHTLSTHNILFNENLFKSAPNLRDLRLQDVECHMLLRKDSTPRITSLVIGSCNSYAGNLVMSLRGTLTHLKIDCHLTDTGPDDWLPTLTFSMLSKLKAVTFVLRNFATTRNEAAWTGDHRTLEADIVRDSTATVTHILEIVRYLPRPQQVALSFALPPLANPRQREEDGEFWQHIVQDLRAHGVLDELLPNTVKEVDWSGVFGKD